MAVDISACIICRNERPRIGAALDSLAWCKDIVIVDSGSTDGTVEFAQSHRSQPRVLHHEWLGYGPQRQFAVEQCRHDWVLMLDADEECSPELAQEIQAILLATDPRVDNTAIFTMPRKNYMAGRYVRCWSPDRQSRLIHRRRVSWDTTSIPESRRCIPPFIQRPLRAPLLHNRTSEFRPEDLINGPKMAEYAHDLADSLQKKGARPSFANLLVRPAATFFKYYILRGGFLDGRFGLVIAYKTTIGVMLKYSDLYAREQLATRPSDRRSPPKP